jgi:hypothetical protein
LISALIPQESVRFLENDAEVHKWVDFDDEVYGHGVITYDLLYGWWSRYKKGAIALFRDDRIRALLALWPLEPSAFGQILAGCKREKDIRPEDVFPEPDPKQCRNWYVSGFAVHRDLRSSDEVRHFLARAIETWKENTSLSFPLEFCAFGYRRRGENSLRRFGFELRRPPSAQDQWPVYVLQIRRERRLRRLLARIKLPRRGSRTAALRVNVDQLLPAIQKIPDIDSLILEYFREAIDAF